MSPWRESWGAPDDGRGGGMPPGGVRFAAPRMTPMVKQIMLVTAGAFLAHWFLSLFSPQAASAVGRFFGLNPEAGFTSWLTPLPMLWQLLTYGLLHALGDLGHIFWNMLTLYFLGVMLEEVIGSRRFLVHYMASVAVAGVFSLAFKFLLGVQIPTVGASGGVAGVVVAIATLQPKRTILLLVFPVTLMMLAILRVGADFFYGITVVAAHLRGEGVLSSADHFAHIGGAVYGFLAVKRQWIWRDPIAMVEAKRALAAQNKAAGDARRMDELLERIHKEGMTSLSERERAFLRRMSKRDAD